MLDFHISPQEQPEWPNHELHKTILAPVMSGLTQLIVDTRHLHVSFPLSRGRGSQVKL